MGTIRRTLSMKAIADTVTTVLMEGDLIRPADADALPMRLRLGTVPLQYLADVYPHSRGG
jgi:hypothetical protein